MRTVSQLPPILLQRVLASPMGVLRVNKVTKKNQKI